MPDPNSLLVWYPKTENLGIRTPRTHAVLMDDPDFLQRIKDFALIVGYPVFLRTDLCSGKHDWKNTCFVRNPNDLEKHITAVCEANEMWGLIGLPYTAIVVREFLDLETSFTAFYGDMPINVERRYFIRNGQVVCHHPYWPPECFDEHPARMAQDHDWRTKLAAMNIETEREVALLTEYAERVGEAMPEYWSVDFAKARGKDIWYLIDMALGKNSYHWPTCDKKEAE